MPEAIGVVGGGIMGSGIAEVASRCGCDVILCEVNEALAEGSRTKINASLERAVKSGKLEAAEQQAVMSRVRFTTDMQELHDRDIIIESVIEDGAEKCHVFEALSKVTEGTECPLASNTSSIPIMKLAAVTQRPDLVVGIHFFNPVPVLPLVELVPSLLTVPTTVERAEKFASGTLGKHTVLAKDRAGFVVNALLVPYLLAAIRMVESGFATSEDVDAGMVSGCAHPMGPLALADLIGLDTTAAVATSLYAEFKEPLYAPPAILLRMVEAGLLGRKTGRGFYDYRRPAKVA